MNISADNPLAAAVVEAIHKGDGASLKRLLDENPGLASARISDPKSCDGMSRSLLHVATDWPGRFPNGPATIAALIEAGTTPNRENGPAFICPGSGSDADIVRESVLTCPHCGRQSRELMPTDACLFFWDCPGCGARLKPRPGHCCVFCSHGSVKCPPIQASSGCPPCNCGA